MKMKFRILSTLAIVTASTIWLVSCKKDNEVAIAVDLVATASDEASMNATQDEIDDMVTYQLSANTAIGGRTKAIPADDRVGCAKITHIIGDISGTFTIDFDTTQAGVYNASGCVDPRGNTRKGSITFVYTGAKWYKQGTSITVVLNDYSINGIKITGSRLLTNITDDSAPQIQIWTVQAAHTATFTDGKTATRTVAFTRTWDVLAETLTITQTSADNAAAEGETRNGNTYSTTIQEGLLYTESCVVSSKVYIPVSGTKQITINGSRVVTFNYGSGDCDNVFTVTYDGHTQTINIGS